MARRVLAAFCWCARRPSRRPSLADDDFLAKKEKDRGIKRKSSIVASGGRWAGRAVEAGLVPVTTVANPGAKRAKLILCADLDAPMHCTSPCPSPRDRGFGREKEFASPVVPSNATPSQP